jgi:Tol biopolymer transport system component
MLGDCASVGGIRRTPWPWGMEYGQRWRYLPVLLLVSFFSGCGGASQPGGGSSGGPASGSPPAIVFQSFRALDGSDAVNTSGAENIWVVSADGTIATPVTKLTAPGITSGDPDWSPDGAKIAFDSNRTDSAHRDIWAVNVDGSHATALTNNPTGGSTARVVQPAWSPDGLKLTVTSICCLSAYSNVAVMNADGSNFAVLTSFIQLNSSGLPIFGSGTGGGDWSPDGSKLIFDAPGVSTIPSSGPQNVWVMKADGSGQTALTNLTAIGAVSFQASWSPDGSKVVFVSSRALDGSDATNANNTTNIWVMNADGTGTKPLTKLAANGANNTAPRWSHDGSKLAFESAGALDGTNAANANLTVNIWAMNADGTGATPLTKLTGAGASSHVPNWSPGGSKLAFESMRAIDGSDLAIAANNIWVMNADGSGATPLTKDTAKGADSTNPKWRP